MTIKRLIDANLNRLREALRLLEDIERFIFNNKELAKSFKELRHKLTPLFDIELLNYRDIINDVSKSSIKSEMKRVSLKDLIAANISRAKESSRVLEEAYKLINTSNSALLKDIRYNLYDLEKKVFKELE